MNTPVYQFISRYRSIVIILLFSRHIFKHRKPELRCYNSHVYTHDLYHSTQCSESHSSDFTEETTPIMEITPIIPPDEQPLEMDTLNCMIAGPEIHIVEEPELNVNNPVPVIELLGSESKIRLFTNCSRQYLVMHFKTMRRFFFMDIVCEDDAGKEYVFKLSNKTSFITIDKNVCTMPFQCGEGWQYSCIDLEDIMANAFTASFYHCREVIITGTCRIGKFFFQSKKYSDIELPLFLRVVTEDNEEEQGSPGKDKK